MQYIIMAIIGFYASLILCCGGIILAAFIASKMRK